MQYKPRRRLREQERLAVSPPRIMAAGQREAAAPCLHHGRRAAESNRTLPPIRAGPRTGTALHFNNFVEKRINRSHPKNAVVSNYKNGRINRALTPLLDRSSPMKTVARISLVALLLAGFATPASATQAASPARHDDSASSFGRLIQDWCIFPPSPWCDRKMNRWFD